MMAMISSDDDDDDDNDNDDKYFPETDNNIQLLYDIDGDLNSASG